ncbi:hypothetical protein [Streptomyces sp. NPDC057702]|uniref:hypothetical protein n=1 Tax=Streptomyces sp. NPDC057702 TaxID=3346221 RepID=UPI0036BBCC46
MRDEEFDRIVQGLRADAQPIDPTPYGGPQKTKPGLTKRGKIALGVGAAVLAGGSLIGWQMHSAQVAESEAKAEEIALKVEALELEKLREMNRAAEQSRKSDLSQARVRQAAIDACMKGSIGLTKEEGGPSRRDVERDCQARYPEQSDTSDMEAVSTVKDNGGGDVNGGLLLGGGALALVLVAAAKKAKRHEA